MVVVERIQHVATPAFGPHDAGGAEKAQVVAHEGGRQPGDLGDFADRGWPVTAFDQDPKPARVAKEPKDFGQFVELFHAQSYKQIFICQYNLGMVAAKVAGALSALVLR